MAKRKREAYCKPSKKVALSQRNLDDLPVDAYYILLEYLDTHDVISLRRTNKNLFEMFNLGTLLTEKEFFKFIMRSSFEPGLIFPHPFPHPKIKFYDHHLKNLHRIKPVAEIRNMIKFLGTDPNLPCDYKDCGTWEIHPNAIPNQHYNAFAKVFENCLPFFWKYDVMSPFVWSQWKIPIDYFHSSVVYPGNLDSFKNLFATKDKIIEANLVYHLYKCDTIIGNKSYLLENVSRYASKLDLCDTIRKWCYCDAGFFFNDELNQVSGSLLQNLENLIFPFLGLRSDRDRLSNWIPFPKFLSKTLPKT